MRKTLQNDSCVLQGILKKKFTGDNATPLMPESPREKTIRENFRARWRHCARVIQQARRG